MELHLRRQIQLSVHSTGEKQSQRRVHETQNLH